MSLTHWGRVTHMYIDKLTIIGSDNGLLPGRCHAIIWTNDGISLIKPLGTNFSEILSKVHTFSFMRMHMKMLSAKSWPFCLGRNVLNDRIHFWQSVRLSLRSQAWTKYHIFMLLCSFLESYRKPWQAHNVTLLRKWLTVSDIISGKSWNIPW